MKTILVPMLLVLLSSITSATDDEFTVWGYLPEYRLGGFNYEAAFQTGMTHLIYFSLEIDVKTGVPSALDRLPSKEQAKEARIAADKVGGKIILSLGGNARSEGFPTAAKTKHSRKKFLKALDKILREYQFDGVDYNWEYPRNDVEWRQWGQLLRESKEYLLRPDQTEPSEAINPEAAAAQGKAREKAKSRENYENNIVTFTMYLDPNHYDVIIKYNLLKDADYVHCMAYDQHGAHSTMEFAERGIQLAKSKKFNLKKFTLGVPFYARHIDNGEPKTWYDLVDAMQGKPETQDALDRYYFNNKATIRKKTKLAAEENIGGIMIWEIGQDKQPMDHPTSLMTALNEAAAPYLKRNLKKDEL